MTIEGVDYAWERPSPSALRLAGKSFVCRYLSYNKTGKNLSAVERDALWAAGLGICLNWENRADDIIDGFAGGAENAKHALTQANLLGAPSSVPIYFSVDQDTRSNPAMIDAYFKGIRTVLPVARIGVYGGLSTVQRAVDQGLASWYWQTAAWSGGAWMKAAHLQQYRNGVTLAGADLDLDRAMRADFGQWTGEEMSDTDGAIAEQYRMLALLTLNPAWANDSHIVTAGRMASVPLIDKIKAMDAQAKANGAALTALAGKVDQQATATVDPAVLQAAVDAAVAQAIPLIVSAVGSDLAERLKS
jgi:hypothetical protein